MDQNNKFCLCAVGIFVSYFYFGILQEKITRGKYTYETIGEDGTKNVVNEKFTYALSLVLIQCLVNYLIAKCVLYIWPQGEDKTSKIYYSSVALTYLLAMVCSNMALQWVSYPTQVVGKSAKPIPVMIFGVLLGRKTYALKKYLFVLLIVVGVMLFIFKEKGAVVQDTPGLGLGEVLLALSLIMDGLTGAIQERIRSESKPSGHQMMKTSNGWSTIYLGLAVVLTGEGVSFMEFASRHPDVIYNLLILGITQAIGQLFLYSMVSDFGPLAVSIVTTTRKCFTVLASVLLFGNTLGNRQWLGASFVFTGLFLDAFYAKGSPKKTINSK